MSLGGDKLLDVYNDISINQIKSDVAFRTLVECVNENLYVIPKYKRKFRWSKKQIQNLAASLINGLPIPPIYTYRNKENQLEILDGQQRIISLFLYYYGKIVGSEKSSFFDYQNLEVREKSFLEALEAVGIKDCNYIMDIEGESYDISYNTLPKQLKRKVDYTSITIIEIKIESEKNRSKILKKIFSNLNKEGRALTNQELRNGIYQCLFYDMLSQVNDKNQKWRNLYGRVDERARDVEILLRLCAMKYYVKFDLPNECFNMESHEESLLDDFSEEAIGFNQNQCAEYRKSLEDFFERFRVEKNYKKSTLLDSLFIVTEKTPIDCKITDDICETIVKAKGFSEASRQGTMSVSNMKRRWNIAYEQLSKYDRKRK